MINWNNLDTLNSYKKMLSLAGQVKLADSLDASRVKKYEAPMAAGLTYNYAAKQVNDAILTVLQELGDEQELIAKYKALLDGDVINTGENRKVLHQLARGQLGKDVVFEGKNLRKFYAEQQDKIAAFAKKVHAGEIKGSKGDAFTTVVQIGIGGSDLGPRALYLALESWARANGKQKMTARFISNVDPDDASAVVAGIDLAKTLFILVSKSGTTQETLSNELFVKDFLKKAGLDSTKHMIAVTSETSPLANNPSYLASFYMDDFIGGRYSSSSAVGGAVLSLAFGPDTFADFLSGAHEADKSALEADIRKNPALLDALIGVYERNALLYPSTAILPYSQALSRFPAHLQQTDMESNGKQVNRAGDTTLPASRTEIMEMTVLGDPALQFYVGGVPTVGVETGGPPPSTFTVRQLGYGGAGIGFAADLPRAGEYAFVLYDVQGRVVGKQSITAARPERGHRATIEPAVRSAGIYFLRGQGEGLVSTSKIVVLH